MKKSEILVPIFTPFKKDRSVDYDALRKLVRFVLDKGADGLYTTGSSAEAFLLTEEERKKTLEVAMEQAEGKTVVAHVGAPGTALAVMYAQHAKKAGVDAVASVPPFYFSHNNQAIKKYYTDIAEQSKLPVMIYNIPGSTGVHMSSDQINDILSDDRIYSIKYTAPNYYTLERVVQQSKKPVYSGMDEAFAFALMAGAYGAIGTTMNIFPQAFIKIKKAFDRNDIEIAQEFQTRLNNIIQAVLDTEAVLPAMKYVSQIAGVDCGPARLPFREITKEEKKRLEKAVEENAF